jgi:hypothetical protein
VEPNPLKKWSKNNETNKVATDLAPPYPLFKSGAKTMRHIRRLKN